MALSATEKKRGRQEERKKGRERERSAGRRMEEQERPRGGPIIAEKEEEIERPRLGGPAGIRSRRRTDVSSHPYPDSRGRVSTLVVDRKKKQKRTERERKRGRSL